MKVETRFHPLKVLSENIGSGSSTALPLTVIVVSINFLYNQRGCGLVKNVFQS